MVLKKYNINLTFRMLQNISSEVTVKTITPSLFKKIKRSTGDKLRKLLTKTSGSINKETASHYQGFH